MQLFDQQWEAALKKQYDSTSKYFKPFIYNLTFDPRLKEEKLKIELLFQNLPKEIKPDILSRIRSTDNIQHFSVYQELVVYQILNSLGYSVTIQPSLKEGRPDLLINGKNLKNSAIVEVATVFDEPNQKKEEKKLNRILECLAKIKHHFLLSISVESEKIPEKINYDRLEQSITLKLDSCYKNEPNNHYDFEYRDNDLQLLLHAAPCKEITSIVGSYGLGARCIGSDQIKSAISKKINRYKSIKELGYIFLVALNLTNAPAGEDGLIDVLFGRQIVRTWSNKNGDVVRVEDTRDSSGLLRPKPGLGGKVQNTRLSAILAIRSSWIDHENRELVSRKHFLKIIHNPSATIPLHQIVFKGLPQYVNTSNNPKMVEMNWIDEKANNEFYC